MPEGPSILILKDEVQSFTGKIIINAAGESENIDFTALKGKKIRSFKTWGKHFLICFPDFTIRIHLLLFGSWRINSNKESLPQLSLHFENGEINLYACSVKKIDSPLDEVYNWEADVMSNTWDTQKAIKKIHHYNENMICDALLDQHIFSGIGNIIKNEILFRTHIHPASLVGKLPSRKLKDQIMGKTRRRCFYCTACQKLYN